MAEKERDNVGFSGEKTSQEAQKQNSAKSPNRQNAHNDKKTKQSAQKESPEIISSKGAFVKGTPVFPKSPHNKAQSSAYGAPTKTKTHPKRSSPGRRAFKLGMLFIAIALVLVAGRYLYVMFLNPSSAFDTPPQSTPIPAAIPTPAEHTPLQSSTKSSQGSQLLASTPAPILSAKDELKSQADISFMKNKVNILMLGWDQSPEREDANNDVYRDDDNNYRSDVIMMLTVDFDDKTAHLISVPRDTYAPIYNTKGRWKINAAFAKGGSAQGDGFVYAMNTVSALLGVPIDYYAGVDMTGLKAVVDAMGGVYYDVDVEIKLNGRVLEKGYQLLNGQQVLDYCRARKGISTDVGRNDRQQRMLLAIFDQLKETEQLVNLPSLYNSLKGMIHTNLNGEQIAALTVFALSLNPDNIERHTLEGEYISNVYNNASFYVLDHKKLKSLIKGIFGIEIETNSRYSLQRVKADKAATETMRYMSGAEYLLEMCDESATGASDVLLQLEVLNEIIPQDVAVSLMRGETDTYIDPEFVELHRDRLLVAMSALCEQNSLTQAALDSGRMPIAFYNKLPLGASAS